MKNFLNWSSMAVKIKNPIYLILINWIILVIGYLGIPQIPLDATIDQVQNYILSFLVMNFNFYGQYSNVFILSIAWTLSTVLFAFFSQIDWKIPIYGIFAELVVYIFAIVLLKRHSPLYFALNKFSLLKGFGIVCAFFSLIYAVLIVRYLREKHKKKADLAVEDIQFLSKCPHCGKEYQSNPKFCYFCSKRLDIPSS